MPFHLVTEEAFALVHSRLTEGGRGALLDEIAGFFVGWRVRPSPGAHLRIVRGGSHRVLAIDDETGELTLINRVACASIPAHLSVDPTGAYLALACFWAAAMPALVWLGDRFTPRREGYR